MAVHYRKLGRTSSQRKALLRNQVTALINNGRITTTEAKAEEIQRIAERLIALAVKEKDNFETVKVTAKVARKDKDGKRVKQIVDKETGKVLGAQMMCARATDMISQFAQAIVNGLTLDDMSRVIYPHPTFSEGIGESVK